MFYPPIGSIADIPTVNQSLPRLLGLDVMIQARFVSLRCHGRVVFSWRDRHSCVAVPRGPHLTSNYLPILRLRSNFGIPQIASRFEVGLSYNGSLVDTFVDIGSSTSVLPWNSSMRLVNQSTLLNTNGTLNVSMYRGVLGSDILAQGEVLLRTNKTHAGC